MRAWALTPDCSRYSMGDMNEPFDEASARRPGFVFVFTVTAAFTFVAGLVWAIVALVFNSGPWICSESGDDLVSRPSAAAVLICHKVVRPMWRALGARTVGRWGPGGR